MKQSDRQTRSRLMELFKQHGFNPRTDLGQNFLIDLNLIEFIVEQARLGQRDVVLEVGAGTGGMTMFMAQYAGSVVSVEVDRNMHMLATANTQQYDNVTLLRTDILKNKNRLSAEVVDTVEKELAADSERQLKLVANLPYNVATPVVSNLVATDLPWSRMVITIQLELAQKMAAKHTSGNYGALSAWLQSQCSVEILKTMKPTVFWPRPKVQSAIVLLEPDPEARNSIADRAFYHDFVRRLFHHRRKYLRSVLVGMYRKQMEKSDIDAVLSEFEFPEGVRAEQLEVSALVELSNRLQRAIDPGEPKEA